MKPSIDPNLQAELKGGDKPLSVFAKLKPTVTPKGSEAAAALVKRVAKKTKESPQFNFRDLDSVLHVKANPTFIRELIRQPEILGASMVPNLPGAMIEPINPRDVPESAISEPVYPRRRA